MTEEVELVTACLTGDAESLRAFVRRFQVSVFGVCFRMLGHREDAEDVAQEVFLRAIRSLSKWDRERPLTPWLLTIAANRCRTRLSQRVNRPLSAEFVEEPAEAATASRLDLAEELQMALERLREDYRLCFTLYHQNELSLEQISEIVDKPIGTVKTWLHRARKELAEHLQRRGIVPQVSHGLL